MRIARDRKHSQRRSPRPKEDKARHRRCAARTQTLLSLSLALCAPFSPQCKWEPVSKNPLYTWTMQRNRISKRPIHKCGTHYGSGFKNARFTLGNKVKLVLKNSRSYLDLRKGKHSFPKKVPIHTGVHKGNCKRIQFEFLTQR